MLLSEASLFCACVLRRTTLFSGSICFPILVNWVYSYGEHEYNQLENMERYTTRDNTKSKTLVTIQWCQQKKLVNLTARWCHALLLISLKYKQSWIYTDQLEITDPSVTINDTDLKPFNMMPTKTLVNWTARWRHALRLAITSYRNKANYIYWSMGKLGPIW